MLEDGLQYLGKPGIYVIDNLYDELYVYALEY